MTTPEIRLTDKPAEQLSDPELHRACWLEALDLYGAVLAKEPALAINHLAALMFGLMEWTRRP